MVPKPAPCQHCPINHLTGNAWVGPDIPEGAAELIVGEAAGESEAAAGKPFVGKSGQFLGNLLKAAKQRKENFAIVNTLCCKPPENIYPGSEKWKYTSPQEAAIAAQYCWEQYGQQVVRSQRWNKIIALGGHALKRLTGREGIDSWRGAVLPLLPHQTPSRQMEKPNVIGTLHPSYLLRTPTMVSAVIGDLRKSTNIPPENYNLYPSIEEVAAYRPKVFAFDFEWDAYGNITLCGLSDRYYYAMVVPFEGGFVPLLKDLFESAEVIIGHNIVGADTKHTAKLGWDLRKPRLVDTMLLQHVCQPSYKHSLEFVASVLTNKPRWKGRGDEDEDFEGISNGAQYKTWNSPYAVPREWGGYGGCRDEDEAFRLYNARDVDATYQIYHPLCTLGERYNVRGIHDYVSIPVAYICRDLGDAGVKLDTKRLGEVREGITKEIESLDAQLPEGLRSRVVDKRRNVPAPAHTYKAVTKVCRGTKKSPHEEWGVHFAWQPGIPAEEQTAMCGVCRKNIRSGKPKALKVVKEDYQEVVYPWQSDKQTAEYAAALQLKEVYDRKTGNITTGKNARKIWVKQAPEFGVVDKLKVLATLKNNFTKEALQWQDRIYFNLLPHGTSEGRLSSTARRRGVDLQIQNLPKPAKKLLVPDHEDWCFVNADVSQGENLLRAWFAKDWKKVEAIRSGTYDEHSDTATKAFGCVVTKDNENKHLRNAGKIINHARGYGGGVKAIGENLRLNGMTYNDAEVREMLQNIAAADPYTTEWQQKTVQTAQKQGYLENPFGRKLWVSGEHAATKALAFLPASTLADCVLRMMIAVHSDWVRDSVSFWEICERLHIQERWQYPAPWRMTWQVHDSLVQTGPLQEAEDVGREIARIMRQPWEALDGFSFGCEVEICWPTYGDARKIEV